MQALRQQDLANSCVFMKFDCNSDLKIEAEELFATNPNCKLMLVEFQGKDNISFLNLTLLTRTILTKQEKKVVLIVPELINEEIRTALNGSPVADLLIDYKDQDISLNDLDVPTQEKLLRKKRFFSVFCLTK